MINPNFYSLGNAVATYFGGKTLHYPVRDKVSVVGTYKYTLSFGENMYTLASTLFGSDREFLWTIIAEINDLRDPDDWEAGEVVNLPKIIINETTISETIFTNVKTNTTQVSITN